MLRDEQSYTLEDLRTYHCSQVKWMHISDVDPSMVVGFYFKNLQEFNEFLVDSKPVNLINSCIQTKTHYFQLCKIDWNLTRSRQNYQLEMIFSEYMLFKIVLCVSR